MPDPGQQPISTTSVASSTPHFSPTQRELALRTSATSTPTSAGHSQGRMRVANLAISDE